MSAVEDLLVRDACDESVRSVVFVSTSCDLLSPKDEDNGQKRDNNVDEQHKGGNEARKHVLVCQEVDLVAHLEKDTDAIFDESGDEEDATDCWKIRGRKLAYAAHCGNSVAGRRWKI